MGKEIPINADKDGDGKVTVQTAKGSWGDAKLWQAVGHPLGLCQQRARRDSGAHPSPALSHSPAASWAAAEAGPKLFVLSIKRQAKDAEALLAWLCAGDTEACEMIATGMSAAASQPERGAQQSSLHCKGWHRRGLYGKKWGLLPNTRCSRRGWRGWPWGKTPPVVALHVWSGPEGREQPQLGLRQWGEDSGSGRWAQRGRGQQKAQPGQAQGLQGAGCVSAPRGEQGRGQGACAQGGARTQLGPPCSPLQHQRSCWSSGRHFGTLLKPRLGAQPQKVRAARWERSGAAGLGWALLRPWQRHGGTRCTAPFPCLVAFDLAVARETKSCSLGSICILMSNYQQCCSGPAVACRVPAAARGCPHWGWVRAVGLCPCPLGCPQPVLGRTPGLVALWCPGLCAARCPLSSWGHPMALGPTSCTEQWSWTKGGCRGLGQDPHTLCSPSVSPVPSPAHWASLSF